MENLVKYVESPTELLLKFIPYAQGEMGYDFELATLSLGDGEAIKRKLLRFILKYYFIKGTKKGYRILFGMLGMTMVLTEHPTQSGFDQGIGFDDAFRTFDLACPTCTDYSVELTGSVTLTDEIAIAIGSIIRFNEPIDMKLRTLTYNGTPVNTDPAAALDRTFEEDDDREYEDSAVRKFES